MEYNYVLLCMLTLERMVFSMLCACGKEPRLTNSLLHQLDLAGEVSIQVSIVCSMLLGLIGSDQEYLLYPSLWLHGWKQRCSTAERLLLKFGAKVEVKLFKF